MAKAMTKRILESISMLETLKSYSCRIQETSTGRTHTVLKDINPDSFNFVINEAIRIMEELKE